VLAVVVAVVPEVAFLKDMRVAQVVVAEGVLVEVVDQVEAEVQQHQQHTTVCL